MNRPFQLGDLGDPSAAELYASAAKDYESARKGYAVIALFIVAAVAFDFYRTGGSGSIGPDLAARVRRRRRSR